MRGDDTIERQPSQEQPRRPYREPQLEDLGTITELTGATVGRPRDGSPQGSEGSQGM